MAANFDIAIVGGGASGLCAAIAAGRRGARCAILEKLPRTGKKILATGNGRCNLGNLHRGMSHYKGSLDPQEVLGRFPGEEAFFGSLGLYLQPDQEGRLYPMSNQAASVLDALRIECVGLGIREICNFAVENIRPGDGEFTLFSESGDRVTARRVVLAAGGCAAPKLGTKGDSFKLARGLGHRVSPLHPGLAPISVEPGAVKPLKGIRCLARVTGYRNGQKTSTQEGQVQFTEKALSGICVFNLAQDLPDELSLDLLPGQDNPLPVLTEIYKIRAHAPLEDFLTGLFPKRVGQVLIKAATDLPLTSPVSALPVSRLNKLAARIKDWRFAAFPGGNWDAAQVTAGGVTGIGPTLESPKIRGLYFAGELLDVHADCGGFNLRWAWASGFTAGENAGRSI